MLSYYEKYEDEQDKCHRFILSIEEALKDALAPLIGGLSDIWGQINIPKISIDPLANWIDSFSKQLIPITDSIQKRAAEFYKVSFDFGSKISSSLKHVTDFSNILSNVFDDFSNQIGNLLSEIDIPSISEDYKDQLRISHRIWGSYGWTIIPMTSVFVYNVLPTDQKEADKIALTYCTTKNMDELFTMLRKTKRVKQFDLDEAIFCFRNKKYRACCLTLFSLIEAKLIRAQRNEDRDNRGRRPLGCKALSNIRKRIDKDNEIDEKTLYWLMSFETLFACINNFFKDGDDFKHQPKTINRNFISHGMITRKIQRKDCVQLFLLYINFLRFLDVYYGTTKGNIIYAK